MRDKIQIGIACGGNSEHFVEFLINSVEKTVSNDYEIEYILGVNPKVTNMNFFLNLETKFKKHIYNVTTSDEISSTNHGSILDHIFNKMDSKYGMVVDCDVAFLMKDWDKKLISELNEETVIIGTEYELKANKFMGNPNAIMSLFLVDKLKKTGLSWKPEMQHLKITEQNKDVYKRKVGEKIFLDTSSEIPSRLYKNSLRGVALPLLSLRNNDKGVVFMKDDMRGEEHHYKNIPILTHVGRGSTRDFFNDPIVVKWKKRVEEWLEEKR